MLTVNKLIPQGRGLAAVLLARAAAVELDRGVRGQRHFDATDSLGRVLAVQLPPGSLVRGGDVLVAEDGSLIRVHAAPQPVLALRPCPQHGSPLDLVRAAYHLGRRQVPLQLAGDHLRLEPDPGLKPLLDAMHLTVSEERSAFEPEADDPVPKGAGHDHAHAHARAAHVHGPGCGHAHDGAHRCDPDHHHGH